MPTLSNLIGSGNSALTAIASLGVPTTGLIAGGTVQTDATAVPSDFSVFNVAAVGNFGARLPASQGNVAQLTDTYTVVNHSGQIMKMYPPVGGTIANAAVNVNFAIPINKVATFQCLGSGNWSASVSA